MSNKNIFKNSPWSKAASEAQSVVADILGINVEGLRKIDDGGVKALGQKADEASQQTKRIRTASGHIKRFYHTLVSQNKLIQGVIREGLDSVKSIRREEAKTAKHAARIEGQIKVLDERTTKGIELIQHGTQKEIQAIGNQFQLAKQQIDQRYASLTEYVNEVHGDSINAIQERAQRRIQQSKTPWK